MKCNKCQWPNKPESTHCVKCGAPLVREEQNFSIPPAPSPIVGDGMPPAPAPSFGAPQQDSMPTVCPKCGYPLRIGAHSCPNCRYSLQQPSLQPPIPQQPIPQQIAPLPQQPAPQPMPQQPQPAPQPQPAQPQQPQPMPQQPQQPQQPQRPESQELHKTRMFVPKFLNANDAQKPLTGTVNPYAQPPAQPAPSFTLKPLPRPYEQTAPQQRQYTGESVSLNRLNTDEENTSITSREQAVIARIDGQWTVVDHSSLGTTFVQALHPITLHNGDRLLMGDRLFEFHDNDS